MTAAGQRPLGDDFRESREEVRGIRDEVRAIGADFRELLRTERELAKEEVREQIQQGIRAGIFGGVAALCGLVAFAFVFVTIMFALDTALPLWAAALITTGILFVLLAVSGWLAYRYIRSITVVPKKSITSFREDVRWAREQLSSSTNWRGNATPSEPV